MFVCTYTYIIYTFTSVRKVENIHRMIVYFFGKKGISLSIHTHTRICIFICISLYICWCIRVYIDV